MVWQSWRRSKEQAGTADSIRKFSNRPITFESHHFRIASNRIGWLIRIFIESRSFAGPTFKIIYMPVKHEQKCNATWKRGRHCVWLAPGRIVDSTGRETSRNTPGMLCHADRPSTGRQSDDVMVLSVSCVTPDPTSSLSPSVPISPRFSLRRFPSCHFRWSL